MPLIFGVIVYYATGEERYNSYSEKTETYYDEDAGVAGVVIGYILYWGIYLVTVWVYKGFKENKEEQIKSP